MSASEVVLETPTQPPLLVSDRRMTAESVGVVLAAAVVAITGFVVAFTVSQVLGLLILVGSVPLWGWGCLANKTFYTGD